MVPCCNRLMRLVLGGNRSVGLNLQLLDLRVEAQPVGAEALGQLPTLQLASQD